MRFKVDTHIHSAHSPDGVLAVEEILEAAAQKGFDGVAICDHDRVFTDPIPPHRVQVIRGGEFSTEYGHLLGLFLTRPVAGETFFDLCADIHAQGGLAILAHPFEHSVSKENLLEAASAVDGIEVFNSRAARKDPLANQKAYEFAKEQGLLFFGGSDAHRKEEIGNGYTELEGRNLKEALFAGGIAAGGTNSPAVAVAKSGWVKLKKQKRGNYFLWFAFYVKCILSDLKREKSDVTYRKDR